MKNKPIPELRNASRKLIRELGMLQLNEANSAQTPSHWHALIEINKEPGITISKLGHLLLLSNSTISRIIKALVKNGDVELREGVDKREKSLFLTEQGHAQIKEIDQFSEEKIHRAFEFLTPPEIQQILQSIALYANALEKSRLLREQIKITTLSTSRALRKQIMHMIAHIQKNEFHIPITEQTNISVLKAEEHFCYHHSCNFWYATDPNGNIIGCVGLKKVNENMGEIKKFFVLPEYRGKGVAQKLLQTLIKAALKHQFGFLVLGTVDKLKAAARFYQKSGLRLISPKELPPEFEKCHLDTHFFKGEINEVAALCLG